MEERRVAAWIGRSVRIKGGLTSSEDMTIAGQVDGDVAVPRHHLVIAQGARIKGTITARSVVVNGVVDGAVTADQSVEVGATGSVDGDIVAPRMIVVEGAMLRGRLEVGARAAAVAATGSP